MKKVKAIAMAIFLLVMIAACGSRPPELKTGRYVMAGADAEMAYVEILPEGRFTFNRHISTSYRPEGIYALINGELVLKSSTSETYTFSVQGDRLIFKAGTTLVPVGAVFNWQAE